MEMHHEDLSDHDDDRTGDLIFVPHTPSAEPRHSEEPLCLRPGGEAVTSTRSERVSARRSWLKASSEEGRVQFDLKAYTDEQTAFDDFKAKKCDAVVITGTRAVVSTLLRHLEAMGALPDYRSSRP